MESLVYRAGQHLYVAGHAFKRLKKARGGPRLRIWWNEGEDVQAKVETRDPAALTQMALAMAPLLLPQSDLYVENLLDLLETTTRDPVAMDFIRSARQSLERARTSGLRLTVNGQPVDAGAIFVEIARGILLADAVDSGEFRRRLEAEPVLGAVKWFLYHIHTLEVYSILRQLMALLKEVQGLPRFERDYICIFCRSTEGRFSTVEHGLPESLGNSGFILPRGYTCDRCQHLLARVEQEALGYAPFSFVRIFTCVITKKGQYPKVRFQEGVIERTGPSGIRFTADSKRRPMLWEDGMEGDQIRFRAAMTETKRFNHVPVARMALKAVLAAMALHLGRDYVLDPRFDSARAFIQSGTGLRTRLALVTTATPSRRMMVAWDDHSELGVAARVHIGGFDIFVGVTDGPIPPPPTDLLRAVALFDLWNPKLGLHHPVLPPKERQPTEMGGSRPAEGVALGAGPLPRAKESVGQDQRQDHDGGEDGPSDGGPPQPEDSGPEDEGAVGGGKAQPEAPGRPVPRVGT